MEKFEHRQTIIPGPFEKDRPPLTKQQREAVDEARLVDIEKVNDRIKQIGEGEIEGSLIEQRIVSSAKAVLRAIEEGDVEDLPDDIDADVVWREMRRAFMYREKILAELLVGFSEVAERTLHRYSRQEDDIHAASASCLQQTVDHIVHAAIIIACSKFDVDDVGKMAMESVVHQAERKNNPLASLSRAFESMMRGQ